MGLVGFVKSTLADIVRVREFIARSKAPKDFWINAEENAINGNEVNGLTV